MEPGPRKIFFCRLFFAGLFILFLVTDGAAQNCDSKYLSLSFRTPTWETFSHAAYSTSNEIICSGNFLEDYNGAGHLARFTKNGIPLWSGYYSIDYFSVYYQTFFSKVRFNDFVPTADGGVVVAGTVRRLYNDRISEINTNLALLAKIDKYGAVVWTRTYLATRGVPNIGFNNLYLAPDGDIIVFMSIDNGPSLFVTDYSYNHVFRFSGNGQMKWSTQLATGHYDAGGRGIFFRKAITQLANKNIVIGDAVYQVERGTGVFRMTDGRLHFLSLDYNTGKVSWESSYPYALPAADTNFVPDINNVMELPDGRLSFSTSLYVGTGSQTSLTKKPVTILTDNRGIVQSMVSYSSSSGNPLSLVDVVRNSGGYPEILLDDGPVAVIASINADGSINNSKGYRVALPPNCFAGGARGYAVFLSDNQSARFNLLLSDAGGHIDCADLPVNIVAESIPVVNEDPAVVSTFIDVISGTNFGNYFVDNGYPLKKEDEYRIERNIDCEEPINCCHDMIDSAHARTVSLCEGHSYTLPDNNLVKDPGVYYVVYKTLAGCDSIIYYNITVDKDLSSLTLGKDTCLKERSSDLLRATPGYTNYAWMGTASSADTFRVYSPGAYWVGVANACGNKTASIVIYDQCDFPVYMPGAFTPNGDNLNDYFGVSSQNKNRLIELKIYNRWGQLVFETNTKVKKWDGKYKNKELPTGVFVYSLIMEGLSGNKITKKGKFLLIK